MELSSGQWQFLVFGPILINKHLQWYRDMQLLHAGPPLLFPENDLLQDLIDIYFARFDPYMPLLHRSSFEQSVSEGLHLVDIGFGQVVLAVCALASRWSDDSRSMPEGTDSEHSKGWRWYRQISVKTSSYVEAPMLYDLQLCVVRVEFSPQFRQLTLN